MNKIEFHFDGDIVTDHKISIRTLSKTIPHLQVALDRAYLDHKFGGVFKHSRMPMDSFDEMEFLVGQPRDGGFILDFLNNSAGGAGALNRLAEAVRGAVERASNLGESNMRDITGQLDDRTTQVIQGIIEPVTYQDMLNSPSPKIVRSYGDKSINKEIDSILALIRSSHAGESSFELTVNESQVFYFDRDLSTSFHKVVSQRSLGQPIVYQAQVIRLDSDSYSGKIKNLDNDKRCSVLFRDESAFKDARDFLGEDRAVKFIGCPVIEDGAYDLAAGDIYFIKILQ